jgi:hypothetical protein
MKFHNAEEKNFGVKSVSKYLFLQSLHIKLAQKKSQLKITNLLESFPSKCHLNLILPQWNATNC